MQRSVNRNLASRLPPPGWQPPVIRRGRPPFYPDSVFWTRRAEGWTMAALAREYGVSYHTIWRLLGPIERAIREEQAR